MLAETIRANDVMENVHIPREYLKESRHRTDINIL